MGERLKTWKKKLTKENMAIMALLGILLMVIAIPVNGDTKGSDSRSRE